MQHCALPLEGHIRKIYKVIDNLLVKESLILVLYSLQ